MIQPLGTITSQILSKIKGLTQRLGAILERLGQMCSPYLPHCRLGAAFLIRRFRIPLHLFNRGVDREGHDFLGGTSRVSQLLRRRFSDTGCRSIYCRGFIWLDIRLCLILKLTDLAMSASVRS